MCKAIIERRQFTGVMPGKLCEVRISHLPVTDDATQSHIGERDTVRPEFVALGAADRADDMLCSSSRLTGPQQESGEAALSDGTGRERRVRSRQPLCRRVVMDVVGNHECDEYVRVEQRRHSSSSRDRTSSEVTIVPTLRRGNPVLGSFDITAEELGAPRPRRMRSTTVSLSVRRVSRAIACACLCRSSGRSMVVRICHHNISAS